MRDYHNKGLFDKTLLILYILDHISGAGMKGLFALLWLKSPVLSHHPGGFNMEIRAKSTAAHAMITRLVIFFSLLALCGARVNTFNWLGASVYGAFIMPTEQSELSLHQLG